MEGKDKTFIRDTFHSPQSHVSAKLVISVTQCLNPQCTDPQWLLGSLEIQLVTKFATYPRLQLTEVGH